MDAEQINKPDAERTKDGSNLSRRFLLQAGWAAPVITAVSLPKNVLAGSGYRLAGSPPPRP
jgi:hypothetical protein